MTILKNIVSLSVASAFGGAIAIGGYKLFVEDKKYELYEKEKTAIYARYSSSDSSQVIVPEGLNFIFASNVVRPTVVHIKSTYQPKPTTRGGNPHFNDPFFRHFFDDEYYSEKEQAPKPQQSSGSGVIIAQDGYIVTNNHVIEGASKIEVVLDDKRTYEAKLIGRDPETDLALLKIEEKNLPFARFGNSDKISVGEWVLACGNPFDLTSTITAGIISAKGRNINLLRGNTNYAIESFIQTDAAVNPGNSGGALVNLKGDLIGINTAIASNTGAYAGYSFAVPSTIVKKVTEDLLKFGEVQRALLGVSITDLTAELAKEKNINQIKGVYINDVNENSSAKDAGILKGDVILMIDQMAVNSSSELQEAVAQHRPGESIKVTLLRNNERIIKNVILKNKRGTTGVMKASSNLVCEDLNVELAELTKAEMEKYKINFGLKVVKIMPGKLQEAGIKPGFIILAIDKNPISNLQELNAALVEKNGAILVEGINTNGQKAYFGIGW
ncbi:MAG: Do family serine endopeptidase [Cytophagales bacterium]|nr:MAG: Do family serine endopeptidase [Cytophagales bacterium]